jgi:hypothetical protein
MSMAPRFIVATRQIPTPCWQFRHLANLCFHKKCPIFENKLTKHCLRVVLWRPAAGCSLLFRKKHHYSSTPVLIRALPLTQTKLNHNSRTLADRLNTRDEQQGTYFVRDHNTQHNLEASLTPPPFQKLREAQPFWLRACPVCASERR